MAGRPRLQSAFERIRFGPSRTLNVRDGLPSAAEATRRVDLWLRMHQAEPTGDVLIITGRGAGSEGGVSINRAAVLRTIAQLRRQGVVAGVREQNAGSFVVTVAPLRALLEAPARRRAERTVTLDRRPTTTIPGLDDDVRVTLRALAARALESLGVRVAAPSLLEAEMARQFSLIVRGAPGGTVSMEWLRRTLRRALSEFDDATN